LDLLVLGKELEMAPPLPVEEWPGKKWTVSLSTLSEFGLDDHVKLDFVPPATTKPTTPFQIQITNIGCPHLPPATHSGDGWQGIVSDPVNPGDTEMYVVTSPTLPALPMGIKIESQYNTTTKQHQLACKFGSDPVTSACWTADEG
jgi:hypothetical protein